MGDTAFMIDDRREGEEYGPDSDGTFPERALPDSMRKGGGKSGTQVFAPIRDLVLLAKAFRDYEELVGTKSGASKLEDVLLDADYTREDIEEINYLVRHKTCGFDPPPANADSRREVELGIEESMLRATASKAVIDLREQASEIRSRVDGERRFFWHRPSKERADDLDQQADRLEEVADAIQEGLADARD